MSSFLILLSSNTLIYKSRKASLKNEFLLGHKLLLDIFDCRSQKYLIGSTANKTNFSNQNLMRNCKSLVRNQSLLMIWKLLPKLWCEFRISFKSAANIVFRSKATQYLEMRKLRIYIEHFLLWPGLLGFVY